MRAMVCHRLSRNRSGLVFEKDWPEPPRPSDGEVTIAISHAALNYPDLLMLSGEYQFVPPLPFIPGLEASATVIAIGAGVDAAVLGSDVIVGARCGLLAERTTVSASAIRRRPDALDPPSAAAFTVTALTAYVALSRRGRLSPGERVLVVGSGGGTGLAAVAVAKALGAWVVATASTAGKVDAARAAGADEVHLVPRGEPLPAINEIDLIFDPVGGPSATSVISALRRDGRYLVVGFVGGIPTFDFATIVSHGVEVLGVRAGEYARRDPAGGAANLAAIDRLAASLRPYTGPPVPLAEAARAFTAMAEGTLVGKAVIECA